MLELLIPQLKDRDALRLRTFLDFGGNRKAAAEKLELTLKEFSRQLRQTVIPAIRKLAVARGMEMTG